VPGTLEDRKRLRPIGRNNERYQQMLDELRKLASRILVLARGRFVADLPPTASDEEIGRLMLGVDVATTQD